MDKTAITISTYTNAAPFSSFLLSDSRFTLSSLSTHLPVLHVTKGLLIKKLSNNYDRNHITFRLEWQYE